FFFQAEDGIRDRNVTGVQTCALPISTERVLVDECVADEFMAKLVDKTKRIAVGHPDDPDTTFAYLESTQAAERLRTLVDDAVQQDRKSTRLNSSHVSISYAVFCLKKI